MPSRLLFVLTRVAQHRFNLNVTLIDAYIFQIHNSVIVSPSSVRSFCLRFVVVFCCLFFFSSHSYVPFPFVSLSLHSLFLIHFFQSVPSTFIHWICVRIMYSRPSVVASATPSENSQYFFVCTHTYNAFNEVENFNQIWIDNPIDIRVMLCCKVHLISVIMYNLMGFQNSSCENTFLIWVMIYDVLDVVFSISLWTPVE